VSPSSRPRHIGHTAVSKHTGHFDQGTSGTPPQAVTKHTGNVGHRPNRLKRSPTTWDTSTKTRLPHLLKWSPNTRDTSAKADRPHLAHQTHGTRPEGAKTHRPRLLKRSPNTRDNLAKSHRPSITNHTGHLLKGPHIGRSDRHTSEGVPNGVYKSELFTRRGVLGKYPFDGADGCTRSHTESNRQLGRGRQHARHGGVVAHE